MPKKNEGVTGLGCGCCSGARQPSRSSGRTAIGDGRCGGEVGSWLITASTEEARWGQLGRAQTVRRPRERFQLRVGAVLGSLRYIDSRVVPKRLSTEKCGAERYEPREAIKAAPGFNMTFLHSRLTLRKEGCLRFAGKKNKIIKIKRLERLSPLGVISLFLGGEGDGKKNPLPFDWSVANKFREFSRRPPQTAAHSRAPRNDGKKSPRYVCRAANVRKSPWLV
jgi:hypothetical protein